MVFKDRLRNWSDQLRRKGLRYWITVAVLIVLGVFIGHWLGEQNVWVRLRYAAYRYFSNLSPHSPRPKRTVLVLIEDKEYWEGALARRVPIKRDYLADLLYKLSEGDPQVIALDFNLHSPVPDKGSDEHPDYQAEANELLTCISTVSREHKIVLPITIAFSGEKGDYVLEPSIFDHVAFDKERVQKGYITLPYDMRRIPVSLTIKDQAEPLYSFAAAIVHSVDPAAIKEVQEHGKDEMPFGSFIEQGKFKEQSARYSATEILEADAQSLKAKVGSKIVIIGSSWSSYASGRGEKADLHLSPVGGIEGAFVHANYVEALLDSRTYNPFPESLGIGIEIILSIILAVIFALRMRTLVKFAIAFGLCLILIGISYFLWQNLGLFLDFFVPVILLGGHAVFEQIREWRLEARHHQQVCERKEA